MNKLMQSPGSMKIFASLLAISFLPGSAPAETKLKRVDSPALGGDQRYLAHVSTDKPIYREGEKVYLRSVLLHVADRTPYSDAASAFVTIKGPKGDQVFQTRSTLEDAVTGLAWEVPMGQAGGEYAVSVVYPQVGAPPAERKFDVRAYRAPRLKTQIKFLRDGYGPGDEAVATLSANRAEGGVPKNAEVTITARVDGVEIHRATAKVGAKGNCVARFKLPAEIERGEGTLAFAIKDGGAVETATKTIPILLQTLDLTFFPEGGEFVEGVPNRLYFEARTPAQKPADFSGVVLDSTGKEVAKLSTEHEGRGRVTLTPQKDQAYELRITKPSGIGKTFPLPKLGKSGIAIQAQADRFASDKPVVLSIASPVSEEFIVTLARNEEEVARESVELTGGQPKTVKLDALTGIEGVLIATVWDAAGKPLAERLVYREPSQSLNISITSDKKRYVPGDRVTLRIKTTNEKGEPTAGVVGMTATDDSVLEMIEKREQAPRLPVMVFLEKNVRELADAHVYLDPDNAQAPLALDLLLGTQGWRRFGFVDVPTFVKQHDKKARSVLAMRSLKERIPNSAAFDDLFLLAEAEVLNLDKSAFRELRLNNGLERNENKNVKARAPAPRPQPVAAARKAFKLEAKDIQAKRLAPDRLRELLLDRRERDMDGRRGLSMPQVIVREYAHALRPNRKPSDRIDFAETVYWHAGVKTNEATGEAVVSFYLSDSVTAFRVFADGFDSRGALGSSQTLVKSVQPFYLEPKLPLEVTMGDVIRTPLAFVNETKKALQPKTTITATEGLGNGGVGAFSLRSGQRARQIVELKIGEVTGDVDFVVNAKADGFADKVTRKLRIVPRGFPAEIGYGGLVEPDQGLEFPVSIPDSLVPGSIRTKIAVHPTPLASLSQALERLIREPSGCFEQTSSTTYPLVMAQQYFMSHQGVDPGLVQKSSEILERGYKRLIGFECSKNGYEWFGADPAHEALTAYGLLEFTDMSKVRQVDTAMLSRTRDWLFAARDSKGGFTRKRRALHTWIVDRDCSNGYITWAMLESGQSADSLRPEIETAVKAGLESENSYVVALAANIAALAKDQSGLTKLLGKLAEAQSDEGSVSGAKTSIVGSGGQALVIETTGLAMLAWLRDENFAPQVEKGIKWIVEQCKGGRYGSTQSTVLALRAIVEYDKSRATPKAPGSLQLYVDGRAAGNPIKFDEKTKGALEFIDIAEFLKPGERIVEIHMTGGSTMPYSFSVDYHDEMPATDEECDVDLAVRLSDAELTEGDVTEAKITVKNKLAEPIPAPIAIVGIPGGLEVRHDQLKELVKAGKIATYEVLGRDVVLYWRELAANQKLELPLSFVAEIPGSYIGPASRAYRYYTDEFKTWVAPVTVEIAAKDG